MNWAGQVYVPLLDGSCRGKHHRLFLFFFFLAAFVQVTLMEPSFRLFTKCRFTFTINMFFLSIFLLKFLTIGDPPLYLVFLFLFFTAVCLFSTVKKKKKKYPTVGIIFSFDFSLIPVFCPWAAYIFCSKLLQHRQPHLASTDKLLLKTNRQALLNMKTC